MTLAEELIAAAEDHRERLASYALSAAWHDYHERTALLLERAAARVEALERVADEARSLVTIRTGAQGYLDGLASAVVRLDEAATAEGDTSDE